MEKGNDGKSRFIAFPRAREPSSGLQTIGDQIAMGQHRAFRYARRPAGILQERNVFWLNLYVWLCGAGTLQHQFERIVFRVELDAKAIFRFAREGKQQRGDGMKILFDIRRDDARHARIRLHLFHGRIPFRHRDDGFRAAVVELAFDFMRGVNWIERNRYRARFERAEKGNDELRRVRKEQGNAVALTDAELNQTIGETIGGLVQIAVGEAARQHAAADGDGKNRRGTVGIFRGGLFQNIRNDHAFGIFDVARHALFVHLLPQSVHVVCSLCGYWLLGWSWGTYRRNHAELLQRSKHIHFIPVFDNLAVAQTQQRHSCNHYWFASGGNPK